MRMSELLRRDGREGSTGVVRGFVSGCALVFAAAVIVNADAVGQKRLNVQGNQLLYGTDPVYPFGQGFWHAIVKGGTSGGFDYDREADWYKPFKANFTRVKLVTTRIQSGSTWKPENPWLLLSSNKYDLTRWSSAFWSRLDGFLKKNEQNGRFVILQIIDDVTMKAGANAWDLHPLNPNRNINNLGLPGNGQSGKPDVYDVNNNAVMDVHRQLLNRVLARTWQYGHIIYEIGNEYAGSKQFLDAMLTEIRNFEQQNRVDLPVTNQPSTAAQFNYEATHPDIDLLDFWHAPKSIRYLDHATLHTTVTSLYTNYSKPLIAGRVGPEPDTTNDTPSGRRSARRVFWSILLGGARGGTTKEDESGIENGPSAYNVDDKWESQGILGLQTVLDNLRHTGPITPAPQLVYTNPFQWTWVAQAGTEVVAFVSGAGQGSVQLTRIPAGRYTVKVYDPERAQLLGVTRATVPASGRLAVPVGALSASDDRAVWLTPETFDVSVRWEQQNNDYRVVFEGVEMPPVSGVEITLNGIDVTAQIAKLLTLAPSPTGVRLVSPYLPFPPGVYEFGIIVRGPISTDRAVSRLRVP